jgi:hypothetical protein
MVDRIKTLRIFRNLSSTIINKVLGSKKMRWAITGITRNTFKSSVSKSHGGYNLNDQDVYGRIILKFIITKRLLGYRWIKLAKGIG